MPYKCARVCACGRVVPAFELCACQIKRKAENDRRRPNANDRGYNSRWSKARRAFLDKHPSCAMCGKPATVVDHIEPHRGDKAKFWNSRNWQSLCSHHHNSTKQRIERQ